MLTQANRDHKLNEWTVVQGQLSRPLWFVIVGAPIFQDGITDKRAASLTTDVIVTTSIAGTGSAGAAIAAY